MRRIGLRLVVAGALSVGLASWHDSMAQTKKAAASSDTGAGEDWAYYGHDAGGMRYSPLKQINVGNVSQLKVAWTYHTSDISDGKGRAKRSGLETTPILVDGTLYLTTPFNRVIALDPETGKERWTFDPMVDTAVEFGDGLINRGVATWLDPKRVKGAPCRRRIFEATLDARLIALDAASGTPCADFGNRGQVSLRDITRYWPGKYHMTSPPVVIDDIVVVGSAIDDNSRVDMPSGAVRAYQARTGKLLWKWEPLPPNDPDPSDKDAGKSAAKPWRTGAGNAWTGVVVDPERDLVFVPTGSASPDYYGGLRLGDDKWADSIVALRAKTGEMAWGFQLVHHDLWDYDTAAPPLLATVKHDGKDIRVVIQGNKTGFIYVLNRDTGVPVFPVEELPVPQTDVPGEVTSPTQPFPSAPPALVPQKMDLKDAWGITPEDQAYCQQYLSGLRNEGIFTPPSVKGTLTIPGNVGGMNWSGSAYDPTHGLLIVNTNNLPAKVNVIPRDRFEEEADTDAEGSGEYTEQSGTPYGLFRNFIFAKAHRLPCIAPPWGTLAAVDMNSGTIRWQVPLGSFAPEKSSVPKGVPSLGGPIVTAGGLVFIGGTLIDPEFRAFNVETGAEVWKTELPTSGAATPMTYQVRHGGKQYVVIAAGGHAKVTEEKQSDAIVAYTLP